MGSAGLGAVIFAIRKNRPFTVILFGSLAITAGWVSTRGNMPLERVLFPEGAALLALKAVMFLRRFILGLGKR